jgi:hypothetical protein
MEKNRNAQKHDVREEGALIIMRLRAGDYFTVACKRVGVPVSTAWEWRRLGRGGLGNTIGSSICHEEHVWFYEEVMRVLAEIEGNAVDAWMEEVKKGNWQAARDFLARRFRPRWGNFRRRKVHVHSEPPEEIHFVWGEDYEDDDGQVNVVRFASDAEADAALDGDL